MNQPPTQSDPSLQDSTAILLVEDDAGYAHYIRDQLEQYFLPNFSVVHASRLEEALQLIHRQRFDVVLLDLMLPDSTGVDSVQQVRIAKPDLPVVVLSGSYDRSIATQVLRQGAQDFLHKNNLSELVLGNIVRHAIERHRVALELEHSRRNMARSEARFRTVIEASVDATMIVDSAGIVRFANPMAAAMFGRDAGSLHGQPFGFPVTTAEAAELDIHRSNGEIGVAEMRVVDVEWDGQPAFLASLRDITERKRRDESLRLFRDLVERTNDAFEVFDPETAGFLDVNEKDCLDLGYTRTELLQFRLFDIDPTITPESWPAFLQAIRVQGHVSGEGLHRRKDGTTFPVEYSARLVGLDRQYLVNVVRDITERKKSEDLIHNSERRFRALIENSSDAIAVIDIAGNILYHSPAVSRVDGYPPEALIQGGKIEHTHPDDVPRVNSYLEHLLAHPGEPLAVYWRHRHRDGRWLWLEGTATNLLHDPTVGGIVTNYRDVTERKRAEERIRAQATLLDKTSDAIVVRGLDDIVHFWSKGAERVYGWTAAEVVGARIAESLVLAKDSQRDAMDALRRDGSWSGELAQRRKNGTDITVQCRWTLLRNEPGQPESILCINTDITEQKKLERQFLRAQRMESIGTLAGGIAHDLNNIFTPILLCIGILKLDATNRATLETLEGIETSAKRGVHLVRQVLAFGRGVEGERTSLQPLHLAQEVSQIIKDTFPRSISYTMKSAPRLWSVTGDPTQLHQIMINLCVNARDAMPDGGSLVMALDNLMIEQPRRSENGEIKPGAYVVIQVSDTGQGIPADIRERIFEPFFTTKEIGRGTGLGLSTVMAITKSHGGFVELTSEAGVGTTFMIFLPAHAGVPARSEGGATRPLDQLRGAGELVLLVDDEDIIRSATANILDRFGYRYLTARHGADAVVIYKQRFKEITAVITDMNMPVMGGIATIAALRSIKPDVRIIGMSGLPASEVSLQAKKAGLYHFIAKPYVTETLLETLRDVIANPHSATR